MNHTVRSLLSTTCLTAFFVLGAVASAQANPENGVVSAGQANITANGKTLTINQQSQKAVIDWRGFDISGDETTSFQQPNSSSITLNRVHSNSASQINGNLTANGNIVIVNQNGVVFGAGSQVDVHGLVASTADIDNDHFMNDDELHFNNAGNSNASIINNGSITAKDAGLVGFVAPNVENNGIITAKMGRVHLASGSTATVDFYGDGLMEVQVGDDVKSQVVSNTGTIIADGGVVALTAAAGGNIVHSLINSSGSIRAQSVGQKNGEIIISAAGRNAVVGNVASNKGKKQGSSKVVITGSLDASGKNAGETGGKVVVTADEVVLKTTASVDASGYLGGGLINLGGDYQGGGDTPNALYLTVEHGAVINNRSIYTGNGGRTILWSDGETVFEGDIIATGGSASGDGGFTEVSGHDGLNYNGFADLSAVNGAFGTLLLDPTDITISSAASSSIGYSAGTYTGTAATSNLNVGVLQTQLASASVIVNTASAYAGNGDITVANAISWSSANSLTLTANRDININAAITSTGASTITATAARNIAYNANVTTAGAGGIVGTATNNLTVASGAILTSGPTGLINLRAAGGVVTNTGLLTLNGKINAGTGALTLLSGLNGASRNNLVLDNTTFAMQGASVGAVNLTGFYDINFNKILTSSGAVTAASYNDLNINSALAGGSNSAVSLTAARDLSINANVTAVGTGGITGLATRNLTVASGATVSSGATGATSLRAANGTSTNTGLLTLNGKISTGTGALTLLSGVDASSNRNNLTLDNTTYAQGATVGLLTFTGFNNINLNTAISSSVAVTLAALNDLTVNAALTSAINTAISLTATRDLLLNANVSTTGSGGVSGLATRNLTVGSGATISSGSTGSINLRAAAGVITNQGLLALNGAINVGTGTLTLLSGLNGTSRNSLTLDNTTFLMQGANIAATSLTGFYDINFNKVLTSSAAVIATSTNDISVNAALTAGLNAMATLTAGHDISLNANVAASGTGGVTATATNNLTVAAGKVITAGATGAINLRSAGGVSTSTGLLYLNGMISAGTGNVTLLSGVDTLGNRNNLTLDSSSYLMQGASVGVVTLTGFNNINLNSALTSSGSVAIVASNDLVVNAALTGGSNATINLTASHDLLFNANVTANGTGGVSGLATNNLTIASGVTVASGATGALSLRAANAVATNTGLLTINGKISNGTGTFSLVSGLNGTNRTNLTLDSATFLMQGATIAAVNLTGFNDINLNSAIASTATFSATAYHDLNFNSNITLTGASNITGLAVNNLKVASGATLAAGSTGGVNLRAAAGVITNTGVLTLDGKLITGSSGFGFTLLSGLNGTDRTDLNLNANTYGQLNGGSHGMTITGFRDIDINTSMSSNSSNMVITAQRNLTVESGSTLKTNSGFTVFLRSAGGVNTNLGVLNFGGVIDLTNNSGIILSSGLDSSGNRPDITFDNSNFIQEGSIINSFQLSGFRDITLNHDIISNQPVTVIAQRNLTVGSGITVQTGSTTTLQAAGGVITNTGLFNMNGKLIAGTAVLTLTSGLDSSGGRSDLTLNSSNYTQGATVTSVNIAGFRDVNIDTSMKSGSGSIVITAERNLSVGSGTVFETGNGYSTTLKSAGGNINNVGLLAFNGKLNLTLNSGVSMSSGVDSSGNRSDLTFDYSNYLMAGATTNSMSIIGFRDVNLNRNITLSNQPITVIAQRDLTIGSGVSIQAGAGSATTLQAAGGVTSNRGIFKLNGKINAGNNSLTLSSGLDASGNATDITLDASHYSQPATVLSASLAGFRDVTFNTDFTTALGLYVTASRNLTVGSGATVTAGTEMQLRAASNNINNVGLLTLNGKIKAGTGNFFLSSGVDTLGNRSNLTLDSNSYAQAASIGLVSVDGFNDINLNTNMTSSSPSGINIRAQRNLTIGTGATVQALSNVALYAAGGVTSNTGIFTLDGKLNTGYGGLTLVSGVNGITRSDLTLDVSHYTQPSSINGVTIAGFRDVNINTNLLSGSNINIVAARNLNVASGMTVQSGSGAAMSLQAAGGVITNTGLLNLNGSLRIGTGNLTLTSGLDSSGGRADFTWDNAHIFTQASTVGGIGISGFRDITLASSITSPSYITIIAERNLTVNSGVAIQNGLGNSLGLFAAGANKDNVGILTLNGVLNVGSALNYIGFNLLSGVDANGNRADLTLNNSNLYFQSSNVGNVNFDGFRDITLNTSINSNNRIFANAERDLTIGASGSLSSLAGGNLVAGRNFINHSGAGALSSTNGRWLVYSTDPTKDVAGNLPYNFRIFSCSYGGACTIPTTGNGFIYKTFDYGGISASLPTTAIILPQNPSVSFPSNPTGYSSNPLSTGGDGGFMTVASTDQDVDNISGLSSRAVLIIEPELAKRLDLENWDF